MHVSSPNLLDLGGLGCHQRMVNPALLASVDALDTDALDELIEYAATERIGTIDVTDGQWAILKSRRHDPEPANWLTDDEFDARLDALTS